MEQNEMTPEKSLKLMAEVINKSRKDLEKNSGTPLLFWGIVVAVTAMVVEFLLSKTGNQAWNYLWFAIPVVGGALSPVVLKKRTETRAKNFLGEVIGYIWLLYGVITFLLALIIVFAIPGLKPFLTLATVLLLGFATSLSGIILKSNIIVGSGIVVALGGVILLSMLDGAGTIALTIGLAVIIALIIPGIVLNLKSK